MRNSTYPINSLILNRWSARAMSGEMLTNDELMSLFEAARWAPSCLNIQPWKFIYAKQKTPQWQALLENLWKPNQMWAVNSAALVLVVSNKFNKGEFSRTHSFDTGAAWANLALEGSSKGFVVHGMAGFDFDKAKEICKVPDDYQVEMIFAVGKKGDVNNLPEWAQNMEKPSDRKPLSDILIEGSFQD